MLLLCLFWTFYDDIFVTFLMVKSFFNNLQNGDWIFADEVGKTSF